AVTLTDGGWELARESRERHELTIRFLAALGVPADPANHDAEGIEHHLGPELMDKMRIFCDLMEENGVVRREDLMGE
ncbi:MAG: hypothetical protein JJU11_17015, partial [Candidatus Sumerlaeia bacterium]|nr:hypothetical protein [Candidatus Sumerlaeia bacterium]